MSQNQAELELLREIALPSRLGQSLGKEIWGVDWVPHPFILEMERQIVGAVMDETRQDWFIVNLPNQVGKTSWVGVLLTFWYIGMHPDKQVIFISYSDGYSMEYGRVVRDLMKRHGQRLFGLSVDPTNDGAGDWKLKDHPAGGMLSVGIGGQITGRQGHLVIIDDVLRTMQDAASVAVKDAHWKEWQGAIWGRRQPGSVYVITATRLALDDLSGRALAQERKRQDGKGIKWRKIILPGICEPPPEYDGKPEDYVDMLGRHVGEPLECRFSQPTDTVDDNWFVQAREELDNDMLFDCMVQQRPDRSEAGMFPDTKWKKAPRSEWPPLYTTCRAWDLASTKAGGDFTTGSKVGRSVDGDIYIIERIHDQLDSGDVINKVTEVAALDSAAVPIIIEQERSGAGANIIEFYKRALPAYQVHPAKAEGTKEQRATPYSILQKGGHVWLPSDPEDEEWVAEWVKEHAGMMGDGRRPPHDDQVDTGAHAVNWLLENNVLEIGDPHDSEFTVSDAMGMDDMLAEAGLEDLYGIR